jgi:Xaa-Pro aminopeptidase
MMALTPLSEEYSARLARAREVMEESRLDALFLLTGPNLVYFSGMPCGRSGSRPFIYLLPRRGSPVLVVHAGRQFEARALGATDDVRTYDRLSQLPLATVTGVFEDLGVTQARIGAEMGAEMVMDMPMGEFWRLQEALPGAEFVDASALLWELRMIKSEAEVARIARACEITMQAYAKTFASVQVGMTEAEIERLMVFHMLELGGGNPWVLITSGAGNYDLVSKGGGPRRVEPGDMVWMDGGCTVDGYYSDFGRACVLGGPTPQQVEAQQAIFEITHQAIAMMKPGVPVAEIAARCNTVVKELNLAVTSNISELAGRVGHGLGMAITELPSLSESDPTRLAPGMVVTIEPGVATDYGTFHIEENVLITDSGAQILTGGYWKLWSA